MGSGLEIRPATGVAGASRVRPAATQTASVPDLSGAKAVSAVGETGAGGNDQQRGGANTDYSPRDISIDAEGREVIYGAVDTRSRRLAMQETDEALRRSRAYARAMENGTTPPPPESHADIEV